MDSSPTLLLNFSGWIMATRDVIILDRPEIWIMADLDWKQGLIPFPDDIWPLFNPDALNHDEILQKTDNS